MPVRNWSFERNCPGDKLFDGNSTLLRIYLKRATADVIADALRIRSVALPLVCGLLQRVVGSVNAKCMLLSCCDDPYCIKIFDTIAALWQFANCIATRGVSLLAPVWLCQVHNSQAHIVSAVSFWIIPECVTTYFFHRLACKSIKLVGEKYW